VAGDRSPTGDPPRLALASLSGRSDAAWARRGGAHADLAVLGGVALDAPTRSAARAAVARGREEFLPADPVAFVADQLDRLADAPLRPGVNVRAVDPDAVAPVAAVCATHDAVLEVNAHCRQDETTAAGAGQRLLRAPERLAAQVRVASEAGATVSVKLRTEVTGVDLPALAGRLTRAGADRLHVDAMDSEGVVASVVGAARRATHPDAGDGARRRPLVIANNGVRDRRTVREYLACGADAVSVGRPSTDPAALARVRRAVDEWFETDATRERSPVARSGSSPESG
jgi:TIM-barrel protein